MLVINEEIFEASHNLPVEELTVKVTSLGAMDCRQKTGGNGRAKSRLICVGSSCSATAVFVELPKSIGARGCTEGFDETREGRKPGSDARGRLWENLAKLALKE